MNAETIVWEALQRSTPEERQSYLIKTCGTDAVLLKELQALLAAHEKNRDFLNMPAMEATAVFQLGNSDIKQSQEEIGTQVGPYKLLQKLGEGGMGTVWVAEQEKPVKRRVALKLIKAGMDSAQVIRRFEAERQALALMDHTNIAKVLDAGSSASGRPYFVMELVKGIPITKYCDDHKLSLKDRLELFIPVCHSIQHAHQKGIIHRDIKPSNVLIALYDDKPIPKVIDFGIAKATGDQLSEQSLNTGVGVLIGTPEYMSPEQAALNNLDIDTRSDVYALGVLLYELLIGSTPIDRKSLKQAALMEILRLVREVEPARPSTKLSSSEALPSIAANRHSEPAKLSQLIKGELDWIVMKALEKDRTRRYETANGFAADLLRYLSGEAVLAVPPSAGYRFRKFIKRNQASVIVASLLLLLLAFGLLGMGWGYVQTIKQRDAAEQYAQDMKQERDAKNLALLKADREAKVAQAVRDYLQQDVIAQANLEEMLESGKKADPYLDLKTALERSLPRLKERFAAEPRVEGAIRQTIGQALCGYGDYVQGEAQLARAARLLEAALDNDKQIDHEAVAEEYIHLQLILARVYSVALGKKEQGIQCLRDAQRIDTRYRSRPGQPNDDWIAKMIQAAEAPGEVSDNERFDAVQKMQKDPAFDRMPPFVKQFMKLEEEIEQGHYAVAEKLIRHYLEDPNRYQKYFGDIPALRFNLRLTLGDLLSRQHHADEAILQLKTTRNAMVTEYGSQHTLVRHADSVMAQTLLRVKAYQEAEGLCRPLVASYQQHEPDSTPSWTAQAMLGESLFRLQKNKEALPLLEASYQQLKSRLSAPISKSALGLRERIAITEDCLKQLYREMKQPAAIRLLEQQSPRLPMPPEKR